MSTAIAGANMYQDEQTPPQPANAQPSAQPTLPTEVMDLLDLLGKLVDSDVGRDTLWKLSRGQGTATEDGKAWLAAAATVARLRGALGQGPAAPAPDNNLS